MSFNLPNVAEQCFVACKRVCVPVSLNLLVRLHFCLVRAVEMLVNVLFLLPDWLFAPVAACGRTLYTTDGRAIDILHVVDLNGIITNKCKIIMRACWTRQKSDGDTNGFNFAPFYRLLGADSLQCKYTIGDKDHVLSVLRQPVIWPRPDGNKPKARTHYKLVDTRNKLTYRILVWKNDTAEEVKFKHITLDSTLDVHAFMHTPDSQLQHCLDAEFDDAQQLDFQFPTLLAAESDQTPFVQQKRLAERLLQLKQLTCREFEPPQDYLSRPI